MSNIPYPDVPPLPGVPPLSRAANQGIAVGLAVAAELYALYLKFKNTPVKYPKQTNNFAVWGILYDNDEKIGYINGSTTTNKATIINSLFLTTAAKSTANVQVRVLTGTYALEPDSFIDFEYKEDHKIPNYPIQNGGFANYNKVALPYEIKIRVTKGGLGNNASSITPFITQIDKLLNSTTLLTVVTPDAIYKTTNLIHFDYRKQSVNGATLLIADLTFQEVRVVSQKSGWSNASADGATTYALGEVSPTPVMTPIGTNLSGSVGFRVA